MKKLKRLFALAVVLVVLLIGAAVYFSDDLVREAIEIAGTESMGVATAVGDVDLGWVRDSCEFRNIAVDNPEGFQSSIFLKVGSVSLAQAVPSFLADEIVVPRLEIADIAVHLETDGSKTNFDPIIANIQGVSSFDSAESQASGSTDETPSAPSTEEDEPEAGSSSSRGGGGKQLLIEKLIISNLHVSCIVLTGIGEAVPVEIDIPRIELDNLRSDDTKGSLADNVGSIVLTVLSVVQQTVASQLPGAIARSLTASLEGLASEIPLLGGLTNELGLKAGPIRERLEALTSGAGAMKEVLKGAEDLIPAGVKKLPVDLKKLPIDVKKLGGGLLPGGARRIEEDVKKTLKKGVEKDIKKELKKVQKGLRGLLGGGG